MESDDTEAAGEAAPAREWWDGKLWSFVDDAGQLGYGMGDPNDGDPSRDDGRPSSGTWACGPSSLAVILDLLGLVVVLEDAPLTNLLQLRVPPEVA
jgi:hypothetical protein